MAVDSARMVSNGMVSDKRRCVVVGVSLRKRDLTPDAVGTIARVATEELSAVRLLFLLADEPELLNLRVFGKGSESAYARQIELRCSELEKSIDAGMQASEYRTLVSNTVRWKDVLTKDFWHCYYELFSLFVSNNEFQNVVGLATDEFIGRRTARVSAEERLYLCQYILSELPVLLRGVVYKGKKYDHLIYPSAGGLGIDGIAESLALGRYGSSAAFRRLCQIRKIAIPANGDVDLPSCRKG